MAFLALLEWDLKENNVGTRRTLRERASHKQGATIEKALSLITLPLKTRAHRAGLVRLTLIGGLDIMGGIGY